MSKYTSMDLIRNDLGLAECWIHDSIAREATFGLMRSLAFQMEGVCSKPMTRSLLPQDLLIMPLTNQDEKRVILGSGKQVVVNSKEGTCHPVFPPNFLVHHMVWLTNHIKIIIIVTWWVFCLYDDQAML